jgi:Immunity protein 74
VLWKRNRFKVRVHGRGSITYTEGERKLSIDSELLACGGPYDLVIWFGTVHHWDPPHEQRN